MDSLFKAAAEHSAGVETFDDQTVVAIRVRGGTHSCPQEKMTSRSPNLLARAPGFVYHKTTHGIFRRGEKYVLHCEDVALPKLAERYGTPLYIYSATTIRDRYDTFDAAFRDMPHTLCYSVKANSNLAILRMLARKGCGFDVVSGGELERVLVADRKAARKVVFSGVGKTREELTAALKAGIMLFNVESESELWALAECAVRLRKIAPIALRVNPDVAGRNSSIHFHGTAASTNSEFRFAKRERSTLKRQELAA